MRVLVTGAGGFLGAAIVKAAAAQGHEVLAMVRRPTARLADVPFALRMIRHDLGDHRSTAALIAELRPEVVIHSAWAGLAGAQRRSLSQFDQVEICWRLVEAAALAGTHKFVGIGSQDEYGPVEGRIEEGLPTRPRSAYGAAKLAAGILAERTAALSDVGFAWLRLFAIYGPGDAPGWLIPSLARQMLDGVRPRVTAGTQRWDYLFIDDGARGVMAAATTANATGMFNLSSGKPTAVRSIVERLRDLAAPGMELRFGEVPFAADQIMHMEGANERLRVATGWVPQVTLDEGLARTVVALRNKSDMG